MNFAQNHDVARYVPFYRLYPREFFGNRSTPVNPVHVNYAIHEVGTLPKDLTEICVLQARVGAYHDTVEAWVRIAHT